MIDYELLDSGDGRRLERFGDYVLDRPDPEVLWKKNLPPARWNEADAVYDNGYWENKNDVPEKWKVKVGDLNFWLKLTPFKHTGIFPEQEWEWNYISKTIKSVKAVNILNLFAYTPRCLRLKQGLK